MTYPTRLRVLDVPALSSTWARPGILIACAGTGSWAGASIYCSADVGVTWSLLGSTTVSAVMGTTTDALADVPDPEVWDEGGEVTVRLTGGTPASATAEEVLDGANLALVGDEILQWRTATLQPNLRDYRLSGLRRGRLGTEWATGGHLVGERVVLLEPTTLAFMDLPIERQGETVLFRAVTAGADSSTGVLQAVVMEHAALLPFAPCALSGARAADGALTLTWHRRARFGGEWKDGRDVPLCETEERYEVDVSDGGVLLRTIVARSETAVYSAAEQVSDGVLPGAPVTIAVAQVSSVAGRGRPTSGIF